MGGPLIMNLSGSGSYLEIFLGPLIKKLSSRLSLNIKNTELFSEISLNLDLDIDSDW